MRITFETRKFAKVERNSRCDVLHITPVRVARPVLDCNGVFAIKASLDWLAVAARCIFDCHLPINHFQLRTVGRYIDECIGVRESVRSDRSR